MAKAPLSFCARPKGRAQEPPLIVLLVIVTFGLSVGLTNHPPGETGLDWQNGSKLVIWSALLAWGIARWRLILPFVFNPAGALLAFLCALAGLSAFWSPVPMYTVACAVGFMAYFIFGAFLARYLPVDTVLRTLLWSLSVFTVLGLIAGLVSSDTAWLPPSVEENVYRLQGLALSPNSFGQLAALYGVIAMACLSRHIMSVKLFMAHIILGLTALALTGDRTVLIALIATTLLTGARHFNWVRYGLFGLLALFAAGLFLTAMGSAPSLHETMQMFSRTGSVDEILTLTGRTEIWSAALDHVWERPLFGWGFNGTEALMTASMPRNFSGTAVNAHNMYLQLALTLGLVGLLPGLALIAMTVHAYFVRPLPFRDLIVGLIVFNGLAEADIFATPILTGLLFF